MTFRFSALALLLVVSLGPNPSRAQSEADRLWLVGSQAFADQLYPLAGRVLERLVQRFPGDSRLPEATLLLGKTRLALGDLAQALEAFRRAQRFTPPPGQPQEARLWVGETLFRMKRYQEARAVYDALLAANAASPKAPEALYGYAWCELELKRPGRAVTAFRQLLEVWPEHALAPAASYHLARTLVDLKRAEEAAALLAHFPARYPSHRLLPEARYLLGWSRLAAGQTDAGVAGLRAFIADYPAHELAPQAFLLVAESELKAKRFRAALKAFEAALANAPDTAALRFRALAGSGLAHEGLRHWAEAAAHYNRVSAESPDPALKKWARARLAAVRARSTSPPKPDTEQPDR